MASTYIACITYMNLILSDAEPQTKKAKVEAFSDSENMENSKVNNILVNTWKADKHPNVLILQVPKDFFSLFIFVNTFTSCGLYFRID